jgi:glutamate N-acetyltransferase/amino-acid N-acetyltransferase
LKVLETGLKVPGFSFSAIECGIKYKGRLDYSLIYSEKPCNAAGMFTTNKIFAAPVKLCRERIDNVIHAILINATNANACTGEQGYNSALSLTEETAKLLNVPPDSVLMASTGVIGVQLPEQKMKDAVPALVKAASPENGTLLTEAIMTTDTFPKSLAVSFSTSKERFTVAGTIKGSGMISPNMATLLCFIVTDCPVDKTSLNTIFRKTVIKSLNSITIDGDMSTNDTAIILSPVSDNYISGNDIREFENALTLLLTRLAEMIIMDGEGATKMVNVEIINALNDEDAAKAAKAVSNSLLVKTAIFGKDPNWGRVAAAVGYSGAEVLEESLSIYFDDVPLLLKGVPQKFDAQKIEEVLAKRGFTILVDIGLGKSEAKYLTSDISYDYVKINATYTT